MPSYAFVDAERIETHLVASFTSGVTYCGLHVIGVGDNLHPVSSDRWKTPPSPLCPTCRDRYEGPAPG